MLENDSTGRVKVADAFLQSQIEQSQQRQQELEHMQSKKRRETKIFQIGADTSPYSTQIRRIEDDLIEHADTFDEELPME